MTYRISARTACDKYCVAEENAPCIDHGTATKSANKRNFVFSFFVPFFFFFFEMAEPTKRIFGLVYDNETMMVRLSDAKLKRLKVMLDVDVVTPQKIAVLVAACETIKVRPKSVNPDVVVWTDNVAAYKAVNKLEPN